MGSNFYLPRVAPDRYRGPRIKCDQGQANSEGVEYCIKMPDELNFLI